MKKKLPLGIIIFGVISIGAGIALTFGGLRSMSMFMKARIKHPIEFYTITSKFDKSLMEIYSILVLSMLIGMLLIISGTCLFRLRNWARRASLISWLGLVCFIVILCVLNPHRIVSRNALFGGSGGLVCGSVLFYYLTRHKVKERFK